MAEGSRCNVRKVCFFSRQRWRPHRKDHIIGGCNVAHMASQEAAENRLEEVLGYKAAHLSRSPWSFLFWGDPAPPPPSPIRSSTHARFYSRATSFILAPVILKTPHKSGQFNFLPPPVRLLDATQEEMR